MRFNTRADVYKIVRRKDGQGGYIEDKSFNKSIYGNVSTISLEKQIQIFGIANHKSKNLITMDIIDIDNFCILIDDIYYKPTSEPKVVKNKTYITMDVLENAN